MFFYGLLTYNPFNRAKNNSIYKLSSDDKI